MFTAVKRLCRITELVRAIYISHFKNSNTSNFSLLREQLC